MYLVRTPDFIQKSFPQFVWAFPEKSKELYLTFDDGPQPEVTQFVLKTLRKYKAKATFFCLGTNISQYPELYEEIKTDGHAIGNHCFDHISGWKTPNEDYLSNIQKARTYIDSDLFRPPYGRIKLSQAKALKENFKIVMWDVMSGDFDKNLSPDDCYQNIIKNAKDGSIIVLHDNVKAYPKLQELLPKILDYYKSLDYTFKGIDI